MRGADRGDSSRSCARALYTLVLLASGVAHADAIAVINDLRTAGCDEHAAVGAPVRPHSGLDVAARELALDRRLEAALERAGYAATSSTSFHVRGSRADDVVRRILAERYCAAINDPLYTEIGAFASGEETWIVLAAREMPAPPLEPNAVARRVLELVNAARAEARRCGADFHSAAPPLALSSALGDAALAHAAEMAARASLSHTGADGSLAGDRITRAGYRWRASGENIAAGQPDAEAVVAAWLSSPGHCANVMTSHFTEMGIAFALAPAREPDIYWAQVLAAPLSTGTQ